MKTMMLAILFSLLCFSSCTVEDDVAEPSDPHHPSEVPEEFRGQWLRGTFAMTEFWTYNGDYLGNAFEASIAFDFSADGHYEQYLIFQSQNYGCVLQSLNYYKGTVKFDETSKTFTVYPTQGKYKGFDNCYGGNNFSRDARKDELKVQTFYYSWSESGGTKYLEVRFKPDDEYPSYFRAVSW